MFKIRAAVHPLLIGWILRTVSFVVLSLLVVSPYMSQGQSSAPSQNDLYKAFLGTWRGDSGYFRKAHLFSEQNFVHEPIEIVAAKDKKGLGLDLEYTYGTKGQKGYKRVHRHMVLDASTSRLLLHWKDDPDEVYRLVDFDTFERTGLGKFNVEGPFTPFSQKYIYRGSFELTENTWNYSWDSSTDGVTFRKYGTFELQRVSP